MEKLFGIDFGTGGCKATLIDLEGNILASRTALMECWAWRPPPLPITW